VVGANQLPACQQPTILIPNKTTGSGSSCEEPNPQITEADGGEDIMKTLRTQRIG
jgi:hypothetical protein